MRFSTFFPTVTLAGGLWFGVAASSDSPKIIDASNYASIQEALDAIPDSGGVVRVPPGRYEINEPLRLSRGDVRVEGSGTATHIVNKSEDGRPALLVRPAGYEQAPPNQQRKMRIWRVQLVNFRISGNPKSGDGLFAYGVNEIFLHNLSIDHNGGHGINLRDCYEDARVVANILTYNSDAGLNIDVGHDIVVSANQFEENRDALRCSDSFNLCMNGNNIDDHLRHGVVIENTYGSVVSGNMIEECAGAGIILDREVYGITLSANVLAHNNEGGVDLRHAWGCTVSANTFTINPNWSLRIGPASGRITVTGNNFSNSYIGAGKTRREEDYAVEWPRKGYAAGVLIDGASDIALSGNVFTGLIEEAIRASSGTKRVALVGNIVTDTGRKSGKPKAGLNLGQVSDLTSKSNIIE